MNPKLRKILLAGALSLWSCIASAGPLLYEFSTVLKLNSGPDSKGLEGASMYFSAEIADGTVFQPDPFFGFHVFNAASHQWTIIGSDSVDGTYAHPNGSTFAAEAGWFGHNGAWFTFATFTELAIFQPTLGTVFMGAIVQPEQFGPLFLPSPGSDSDWKTQDGSRYNWADNGQFSVTDLGAVPAPSSLALTSLALALAAWFSTRRRLAHTIH